MRRVAAPRNIIDKIWDAHAVAELDGQTLLHVDRVFLHERTGPAVFAGLAEAGRRPLAPQLVFGTMDHIVDTTPGRGDATLMKGGRAFIEQFRAGARAHGIRLFDIGDARQGIVHVVSPEQGIALPGCTLVCCDSHTCTVGGLGALAWGIGSSEGEHALATQTLARRKPRTMRVCFEGALGAGVTAKDMILAAIGQIGVGGGAGHVVEYAGEAIRALSMENRMTVCNMSIEGGARAGMVAPDDTTYAYMEGRPGAPKGAGWERALERWRALRSDDDAAFDREVEVDVDALVPQVTWGTNPGMVVPVTGRVPDPADIADPDDRASVERALAYMGLEPGTPISEIRIDRVFVGSCTNSRIEDLRAAASVVAGHRVSPSVRAMVVPGSASVKRQAEAEGLDRIFKDAGFEWREAGCSMCLGINPDILSPGERCASTSNRNFEGRQGRGGRTHLVSPEMAAAAAIAGHFVDARELDRALEPVA